MKDKLWNLLLTLAMAAVGFILTSSITKLERLSDRLDVVDRRVTTIEASHMTSADGLQIQRQLADMREVLAEIKTEIRITRRVGTGN